MATVSSENSVSGYLAKYAANAVSLNADAHQLLQSDTLKRHPKMDLDKSDLLQLLGYLEGELQARDIAIAALKLEKTKMMLTQAKYGRSSAAGDPISALQRDSDMTCDKSFDEASVRAMYGDQLVQLERLISTQHACQQQMRDQLVAVEKQYHKTCAELEETKQLHAREVDDMDKVMCLMAKDLDRLKQETEMERAKSKRLDSKLQSSSTKSDDQQDELPVYAKHKQVALMLIRERSRLVLKLLETRKHGAELERLLSEERARARSLDENLERQVAECEQLCSRLSSAESLNRSLQAEIDKLKSAAASSSPRQPLSIDALSTSISNSPNPYAHPSPHTTYISVQQAMPGSSGLDPRRSANAALNSSRRISPEASVSSSLEDVNGRRRSPALERDVAAARLRSVISTAMDTGSAAVDGSPPPIGAGGSWLSVTGTVPSSSPLSANASVIIDRPSSSPRQSSSPVVGGMPPPMSPLLSKLPVLQSTGGGSVGQPGDPYFVPRSLMLSADGSSRGGGGSPMLNTSTGETRTMRRLIPIATASVGGTTSPRLAPLASLMQANGGAFPSSAVGHTGSAGGGYGQKMPSLLLGKPK